MQVKKKEKLHNLRKTVKFVFISLIAMGLAVLKVAFYIR